jgi:O-succinylbenzoate synthase
LFEGPAGWAEFCPFDDYDDAVSASWLATAIEQCTIGWVDPVRDRIPINCTVPAVGPGRAHEIVAGSGCRTAKVKVADHPESLSEDLARVEAVRDAFGPDGRVRVDANGVWDIDTAVSNIRQLDKAAGGLEYVEQPCATIEELAAVRRRVDVRIAADESIRRAEDPLRVAVWREPLTLRSSSAPRSVAFAARCRLSKPPACRVSCPPRWRPAWACRPNWRWRGPCPSSVSRVASAPCRC